MASTVYNEVVERCWSLPGAMFQIVKYESFRPCEERWMSNSHGLLDLGLSTRTAKTKVCYEEKWGRDRFEPLGDIAFYPPGIAVHARSEPGQQRVFHGYLPLEQFREDIDWNEGQLKESLNLRAPSIRQTCRRILLELYEPGFAASLLMETLGHLLAVDLVRHFSSLPMTSKRRGGLTPWQIRRIEERAMSDGMPPDVDELAALCRLSRRHLMRAFKETQSENIGDYVARMRLTRAMQMLSGRGHISEVAFALGFSSPSSFSATFKRATGMQPSAFRQSCGAQNVEWRAV